MKPNMSSTDEPARQHLRQFTIIRSIVLGFWCAFAASFWLPSLALPHGPLLGILVIFSAVHLFTLARLAHTRPVSNVEFLANY